MVVSENFSDFSQSPTSSIDLCAKFMLKFWLRIVLNPPRRVSIDLTVLLSSKFLRPLGSTLHQHAVLDAAATSDTITRGQVWTRLYTNVQAAFTVNQLSCEPALLWTSCLVNQPSCEVWRYACLYDLQVVRWPNFLCSPSSHGYPSLRFWVAYSLWHQLLYKTAQKLRVISISYLPQASRCTSSPFRLSWTTYYW